MIIKLISLGDKTFFVKVPTIDSVLEGPAADLGLGLGILKYTLGVIIHIIYIYYYNIL